MERQFRILLWTSFQNAEDATGYIVPDWTSGRLIAEERLLQFEAGDLSFAFVDRDTDKTARYWSRRIMRSTTVPRIAVYDYAGGDYTKRLFLGWVERDEVRWDGEVLSRFTATTQLSHADRFDCGADFTGGACSGDGERVGNRQWRITRWDEASTDFLQFGLVPGDSITIEDVAYTVDRVLDANTLEVAAAIGYESGYSTVSRRAMPFYSGLAAPITRRILRQIGNAYPEAGTEFPDVRIDDYKHGSRQTDSQWNHVLRTQADAGVDPVLDEMLSEFVPSQSGDRLGFICVHGKLYRVDIAKPSGGNSKNGLRLTQITAGGFTTASRLFRFKTPDHECLVVVSQGWRAEKNVSIESRDPAGTGWATGIGTAAAIGAVVAKAAAPVPLMISAVASIIDESLRGSIRKITTTPLDSRVKVVAAAKLLSIGDGTNDPNTGVGAAINQDFYVPSPTEGYSYTILDACTVIYNGTVTYGGIFYTAEYNEITGTTRINRYVYTGGGTIQPQYIGALGDIAGRASGGMAGIVFSSYILLCIGADNRVEFRADSLEGSVLAGSVTLEKPCGRFVGVLDVSDSEPQVAFLLGNDDNTVFVTTISGSDISVTRQRLDVPGAHTPTGFKLVTCSGTTVQGPGGVAVLPVVYKALDSENREYYYAGYLEKNDQVNYRVRFGQTQVCTYAIPGARTGDVRGPVLWFDNGDQRIWRYAVFSATLDGERLVVDGYLSSLWAAAFVHWDFVGQKMTARELLLGVLQSFGCYARLMDTAAPTSADGIKVVSRFSHTPALAGEARLVEDVVAQPQVTGVEVYSGAVGNVYGEEVKVGVVPAGSSRHVLSLSGIFATPAWVHALGSWAVMRYPQQSSDYPDGRLHFDFGLLQLLDGGNTRLPNYEDVYRTLTFKGLRDEERTLLILGLSFDRQRMVYATHGVLYSENDVLAAECEPDAVPVLTTVDAEPIDAEPTAGTAGIAIHTWDVVASPYLTVIPLEEIRAYWFSCYCPHGLLLRGYCVPIPSPANKYWSTKLSVWRDSGGQPGIEVKAARITWIFKGNEQGWVWAELNAPVVLSPGLYWVLCVVNAETSGFLLWLNGVGKTPRARYLALNNFEFPESWNPDAQYTDSVPAIYLGGDL